MYDLYYLYRIKYNVKLDLSLIMATLSYDDSDDTFLLGKKLTNGEQYWEVKELEVFKIIY